MIRNATFTSARAGLRIARIIEVLAQGPMTTIAIADAIHCDRSAVTEYLRHLMSQEPRQVRIADYETISGECNGSKRPLYALGAEPDAPLTKQSNQEKWAKVRADPEKYEASLKSRRESARRTRAKKAEVHQRDRRVYDPPLPQQVAELVESMPGYTTPQIAEKLGANERAVIRVIAKLRTAGAIRRAEHWRTKEYRWETPINPMPAPVVAKQQGIFAALGL